MMSLLLWPLLALILYSVQTSWFMFFNTTQGPDLLLIFILICSLEDGPKAGLLAGLALGGLQDIVTFTFFGYHIVTRMLIAGVVGAMRDNIFKDQLSTFLILVGIVSAFVKVTHLVFLMIYQGEFLPIWPFVVDMVKYMGWNVLCAVPMWIAGKVFVEVIRRRENRMYRI